MLRLDHVVFPVWNVEASLAFYREIMGFALTSCFSGDDWGGFPWLMMVFSPGDGREVVLVALKGANRPTGDGLARDVRHLAFGEQTVRGLAKWRRRLAAAKIPYWEEDHGGQKSLYFEDPNGVVLEITAPPSRAAGKTSQGAIAHAKEWMART